MGLPLYWQVCLTNGTVFCVGTLVLALSPVRVSERVLAEEAVVLAVGLAAMATLNALLLLRSLGPIDRVIRTMDSVDRPSPDQRLTTHGHGAGARLTASYNAMLDRLETERSASNAKALAAQEAERHRIAQELHDEVGQSLTVVLLGLKGLERQVPHTVRPELAAVRESARTGMDDVRRVARQLRPGVLEDLGLHAALTALTTDVGALGRTTVRRTVGRGLPELPQDRELVLYRVAQEALTNVVRHAHADTAELSLCKVGDTVVLTVSDDGQGSVNLVAGSGISGMRERALLIGADVSVTSTPGHGTTVRLEVPL